MNYLLMFISLLIGFNGWSQVNLKPAKTNIALTFDDGPDPRYTPQILSILKENNIQATFFVLGEHAKRYPELIKQIHEAHHVIANHSMSHEKLTRLNSKQLAFQIDGTNQILEKILAEKPKCVRPPYGMSNTLVRSYIESLNMAHLNWDLNSFDYNRRGVDKLKQWVISHLKAGDVLLMHDGGGNRSQTVEALPEIIAGLKKRGLGFEAICQ